MWKLHLEHARAVRNGIALCNDVPLDFKDPEGGLVELKPEQKLKYNGMVFFAYLKAQGHSSSPFDECICKHMRAK